MGGVIVWSMVSGLNAGASTRSVQQPAAHSGATAECTTCHRFPATRTHVTGVRPTFDVPESYPLGSNGELTCVTCHDTTSPTSNTRSLLREPVDASSFCESCHRSPGDEGSRLAHALRVGAAHGKGSNTLNRTLPLDAASLDCLACHDGVVGGDGHWPSIQRVSGSGRDFGHPVGVEYAVAQRSSATLAPAMMLDGALRLENGKVGCTSCHDPLSRLNDQLVIENRGSSLCLSCHRM
jgi:predicted CXXCH cytochrome family protein